MMHEKERDTKVREGRTSIHVADTGHIPFRKIAVERRGILKHYKRDTKQESILTSEILYIDYCVSHKCLTAHN